MRELSLHHKHVSALSASDNNPRTHTKKQIRQIADSIKEFGFTNPVLLDSRDHIIAGHGRVQAAKLLGLKTVPTLCLDNLSETQIRAYVIADNRLAECAGWDEEILAIEFQELSALELGFDLTLTGFDAPQIDFLIQGLDSPSEEDPADTIVDIDDGPVVTRLGDIWEIGLHRLICGDALDPEAYAQLLAGKTAQMVFTDPPYNVPIKGHVSGLGKIRHREFAMASGEMDEATFTGFLSSVFNNMANSSREGAIQYICMDWRHMVEMMTAGTKAFSKFLNLCVWAKTNGGMGSLYRSKHELVFVFKAGAGPHINNVELGRHGRNRTNVWNYPGINSFGKDRDSELALHPTVKPVALVMDAILDCSKRKGIILDPFAGSGTTFVAAEKTGRFGFGIELDPRYCDVIVRRMQTLFGIEAIHQTSQLPFSVITENRCADRVHHPAVSVVQPQLNREVD